MVFLSLVLLTDDSVDAALISTPSSTPRPSDSNDIDDVKGPVDELDRCWWWSLRRVIDWRFSFVAR
jgi:hypothetical protein